MIDLTYLNEKLTGYQLLEKEGGSPVFFKRVKHTNKVDIYAFDVIIITLDKYTVTIEGFNEKLIARAVAAKAIEINTYEELDALREVIYDNTLEEVEQFETRLDFMEKQLITLGDFSREDDKHQQAVANLKLMVSAANMIE